MNKTNGIYKDEECPLPNCKEWPDAVPVNRDGTIKGDDLACLVEFFAEKGHPIIVLFNYGTVFKGAFDDVKVVGQQVLAAIKKTGSLCNTFCGPNNTTFQREKYWIHVDGALGASYMPFLKMAIEHKDISLPDGAHFPEFDFKLDFVSAISTSGHKWLGAPWACGIYLTRTRLVLKPPSKSGYVNSSDTTFAGSRNAVSPLLIWNHISTNSYDAEVKKLIRCFEVAAYTEKKLKELQTYLGIDLHIHRSPLSLAILFKKPHDDIVDRYSLSNDADPFSKPKVKSAHIFAMPHVNEAVIDQLIDEIRNHPDPIPDVIVPEVIQPSIDAPEFQYVRPWQFGGGGLF